MLPLPALPPAFRPMRSFLARLLFVIALGALTAALPAGAVTRQTVESASVPGVYTYNFLCYTPAGYTSDTTMRWPLLVFLHGSGETGSNPELVAVNGPPREIELGRNYPCVVVSPQSPTYGWNSAGLAAFIDDLTRRYRIDPDRIYVTGLSMGGYGTWSLAVLYPERYAAVVPVCGAGTPALAGQMRDLPVWAFHGALDPTVPPAGSRDMFNAIRQAGGDPRLTIYPNGGHDVWTATYANDQLYAWLFAQNRTRPPARATARPGGSTTLTAPNPPQGNSTFQWQIAAGPDWQPLPAGTMPGTGPALFSGVNTAALTIDDAPLVLNGVPFQCVVSGTTTTTSIVVTVLVGEPPAVTVLRSAPAAPVTAGTGVTMAVQGTGSGLTYQWDRDGAALPGATSATLTFIAGTADAGDYAATVTDAVGFTNTVTVGHLAVTSEAWLANLSARAYVQTGENILIAGFVTTGPGAASRKSVLLRGVGPALGQTPINLPGALSAAQLRLFDGAGAILDSTTTWAPGLAPTFTRLGAFALPAGSNDGAMLESLAPGIYTTHVTSPGNAPGIGLVEVYDADGGAPDSRLVNLSARASVGTGANILIGGFVILGPTAETVLIRAVGPELGRYNIAGPLANPVLTVFDAHGAVIATNRGWSNPPSRGGSPVPAGVVPATAAIMTRVGAFPLSPGSADSALVLTLPLGIYTAHLTGSDGTTGVGLIEIYEVK